MLYIGVVITPSRYVVTLFQCGYSSMLRWCEMLFSDRIFEHSQASPTRLYHSMWADSLLRSQASQGTPGVWDGHFSSSTGALEAQSVLEKVCLEVSDSALEVPQAQIMVDPCISGLASCLPQVWKLS